MAIKIKIKNDLRLVNYFLAWVVSLLIFTGIGTFAGWETRQPTNSILDRLFIGAIVADVVIGSAFFLMVCAELLGKVFKINKVKQKKEKLKEFSFSRFWTRSIWTYTLALIIVFISVQSGMFKGNSLFKSPSPTSESLNISTPSTPSINSPHLSPNLKTPTKAYVGQDPIVNCGPGQNSKQYVKVKQSDCKNYVDCGFLNGSWDLMLKSECEKKQVVEYQNKLQQLRTNTAGNVSISCVTEYGTYTYSGSTYEDAQRQCSDLQAQTRQWKANSDALNKGLQDMENVAKPIPVYFEPLPSPWPYPIPACLGGGCFP